MQTATRDAAGRSPPGGEHPGAAPVAASSRPLSPHRCGWRQVRAFARGIGQRAKTAALDAAVLARFGEVVHLTPRPLPEAQEQELSALVARRRQLLPMLIAERQHLGTALLAVRPPFAPHIERDARRR